MESGGEEEEHWPETCRLIHHLPNKVCCCCCCCCDTTTYLPACTTSHDTGTLSRGRIPAHTLTPKDLHTIICKQSTDKELGGSQRHVVSLGARFLPYLSKAISISKLLLHFELRLNKSSVLMIAVSSPSSSSSSPSS